MHLSVARVTAGPRQTHLCRSVGVSEPLEDGMFVLHPLSLSTDVDECVSGGGVCPRRRKCVNTFGSFLCKCHLGFRLTYINGRYTCIGEADARLLKLERVGHVYWFSLDLLGRVPELHWFKNTEVPECVIRSMKSTKRMEVVCLFWQCRATVVFLSAWSLLSLSLTDKDTRPFCSLNPDSLKCRCQSSTCAGNTSLLLLPNTST